MTETRVVINQWLEEYNTIRPHGSLGGMNPELFLQRWTKGNTNQQPETLTARVDQRSWACQMKVDFKSLRLDPLAL